MPGRARLRSVGARVASFQEVRGDARKNAPPAVLESATGTTTHWVVA
jgi:hypothetical protein